MDKIKWIILIQPFILNVINNEFHIWWNPDLSC